MLVLYESQESESLPVLSYNQLTRSLWLSKKPNPCMLFKNYSFSFQQMELVQYYLSLFCASCCRTNTLPDLFIHNQICSQPQSCPRQVNSFFFKKKGMIGHTLFGNLNLTYCRTFQAELRYFFDLFPGIGKSF